MAFGIQVRVKANLDFDDSGVNSRNDSNRVENQMPHYIQEYCGARANSMEWQFKVARRNIQLGAIALGERHGVPHARAIICDLIVAGEVGKLFLEIPDWPEEKMKTFRDDLLGTDIAESQAWRNVKFAFDYWDQKLNPIQYSMMVPLSVSQSVKVYLFDASVPEPTSPEGMQKRNAAMGEVFQKVSNGDEPGTVILNGFEHLRARPSGGLYEHTVQHTCGIRFQHVTDLGRFL